MSISRYVSDTNRLIVARRANHCCEYCRVSEEDHFLGFQIDHVIAIKHGGTNDVDNLAYCCPHCNQNKGTDLATLVPSGDIVPLFNPRKQTWSEHFSIDDGFILAKTSTGEGTISLLKLNDPDRLILRRVLEEAKRYPM